MMDLYDVQDGKCAICKTPLPDPTIARDAFAKHKQVNVDHCHNTGKVRGILCSPCNTGIGMLDDNADRLRAAIRYLEAPPA